MSSTAAPHPMVRRPVRDRPTRRPRVQQQARAQQRVRTPQRVRPTGVRPPEPARRPQLVDAPGGARSCRLEAATPAFPGAVPAPQWQLTQRGAFVVTAAASFLVVLSVVVMVTRFLAVTA